MANQWLQTKQYVCPACRTTYLHDRAYRHHGFECPARPVTKKRMPVPEKVYEPKIGR